MIETQTNSDRNSPEVFRIKRFYVFLGLIMAVFTVAMGIVVFLNREPAPFKESIAGLLCVLGLFGFFVLLGLYVGLAALLERITVNGDEVVDKKLFKTRRFRFSEVTSLNWCWNGPRLCFVARFQGGKVTVRRDQFSKDDFNRMVYLFRTGVAEDRQKNWAEICLYYAKSNDYRDAALNPPDPSKGEVLVTRACADWLFGIGFGLVTVMGIVAWYNWDFDLKRTIAGPFMVIFFWVWLRLLTPKKGHIGTSIVKSSEESKVIRPLLFCLLFLLPSGALVKLFPAWDTVILSVVSILSAPAFCLFLVRAHRSDSQKKRKRQEEIEQLETEGNLYPEPVFGNDWEETNV